MKVGFATRCLGLLVLSLALCANGQDLKHVTEIEGISEYRLSNGVQALLFPDESKPTITVNMTVLVGSRHEGYGETGMAHLLEHLLFKGTPTHQDIPALLKARGVLNMNGTTWLDRTNYFETLPASDENLEFAIHLEADRLLNSLLRSEDLASEMTVVRNEFEIGENNPGSILMQRILANAYEWHNYGKSTIGNRSDIERVPIDSLRRFYTRFYQPDNLMVVVAGNFKAERALELLEKHFGTMKFPERELSKTYTEEPVQDGERTVILRRVGDVQMAGVGYHIPSAAHADFPACEVLARLLSQEPGGLLYKGLVESSLASSVSAMNIPGHDPGLLLAFCEVSQNKDLEAARDKMLGVIEGIAAGGIAEDQVQRAVQQLLKEREETFADSESMAIELSEWRAFGDWRLYFLHRDRLEKVTAGDVQRVAEQYCLPSNRTVGLFIPTEKPARSPLPGQPNLNHLLTGYQGRGNVAAGEQFDPTPENISRRTTVGQFSTGLQFAFLPKKTRDSRVHLVGELKYGSLESLRGRATACELLGELIGRGTNKLDFQKFSDELDRLRATMTFSGSPGSLKFQIETKRENLIEVLGLLEQALRQPALAASELEIVRREHIAQLESMKSDPQGLAFTSFQREFSPYVSDDPRYAPTIDESCERWETAQMEAVREIHEKFLNGQNGHVAVVGDFDLQPVQKRLDTLLANWTSAIPYVRIPEPAITDYSGKRLVLKTPDKANAVYIAGMMFPIRDDDPDYEALVIANYVLGGGPLASRLADRVRKQEGLSYGVGSMLQVDSLDSRGLLMAFALSNPENTEKVVGTIAEEVQRFLESGVANEELSDAISSYLETRRGARADDRQLAGILAGNLAAGRSFEHQARSDQKLKLLDKSRVDAVIKKWIDPKRWIIITAGDFDKAAPDDGQKKD